MLTVLLGGARSGKSTLAVELARRAGDPVTFVATATASDEEMAERIARHRAERPAGWKTVEAPVDLLGAVDSVDPPDTLVVDCLTLWLNNLMAADVDPSAAVERASSCAEFLSRRPGATIVVSNEVGSGIVPASFLPRIYRDTLGRINTVFAAHADAAYLVVAGRVLPLQQL